MKIQLRAIRESDIWQFHSWINDPEIIQFTNYFRPISEMEQRKWFESLATPEQDYIFGIEIIENKKLIGTCGLYNVDTINRKAELRIKIGEKGEWGKGYGKQATILLTDFGFNDINLHRIWLKVLENNESAIKIYENTGFAIEGLLKDDMFIKGKYKNVVIMGIVK